MEKILKVSIKEMINETNTLILNTYLISLAQPQKVKLPFNVPLTFDGIVWVFCKNGTLSLKVNTEKKEMRTNTVLTVFPHYIVELNQVSTDFEFEYHFFAIEHMLDFFFSSNRNISFHIEMAPLITLSEEEFNDLLTYHYFILDQSQKKYLFKTKIMQKLLQLFTFIIEGFYCEYTDIDKNTPHSSVRQKKIVNSFFQLLINHSNEKKDVTFFADKLCLTPKYISTLVKKYTGRPMITWINLFIILRAKYLLKSTDMTIFQIADVLGFQNPSFFGKFFKQKEGITPGEYREM